MIAPLPSLRAAAIASLIALSSAAAQDGQKPKPAIDNDVARYCAALAPTASEARAAYQLRRLAELDARVREEVEALEARELAAHEWVSRREAMLKAAADDLVAIYAKMAPEAAAPQLAAMDESVAAAVLTKLKPAAAGAILGEMAAEKAAKLASLMSGAGEEKS